MKKINLTFIPLLLFIQLLLSCEGNKVSDQTARMRCINASSTAGDINVFVDYKKLYATDIQYLNYSLFSQHIVGLHNLQFKSASGSLLLDTAIQFAWGQAYSAFIYDSVGQIKLQWLTEDFNRAQGSYCKLRFLHLSNNAPFTDITAGTDTSVLFRKFRNGQRSDYQLFGLDSVTFNANYSGTTSSFYSQSMYQKFKAGYFYTLYLKGNIGSTGIDSVGFFMIENNGSY